VATQNVELVRQALRALNERDVEAWLATWHPDGEWYPRGAGRIEGERHRGHQELRRFVANYYASWDELRIDEDDIRDLCDDAVFLGRIQARGRASGVELDRGWGCVFQFRDGKIARADGYTDPREALDAAARVAVVRAWVRTWNAGDMEAFRELHHPDVVVHAPEGWPEPGPFVGREAAMRQYEQLRDTWETEQRAEIVGDVVEAGDRALVRGIWRGVGHGFESAIEWTVVYGFREGRIVLIEYLWDHDDALRRMGVRP
jgi:ketosteroid isomerase-like protein